jgi:hypothetical protein
VLTDPKIIAFATEYSTFAHFRNEKTDWVAGYSRRRGRRQKKAIRASKHPVEMEKQNINNRIQVQDALLPEQLHFI